MNKNKKKREYAKQVQDIALMALMEALSDMAIAEREEKQEDEPKDGE